MNPDEPALFKEKGWTMASGNLEQRLANYSLWAKSVLFSFLNGWKKIKRILLCDT